MFVNLLDLNDNDPKFLNLPFVAEVPEGLAVGSSVYKVKLMQKKKINEMAMIIFYIYIYIKRFIMIFFQL